MQVTLLEIVVGFFMIDLICFSLYQLQRITHGYSCTQSKARRRRKPR